MLHPLTLPALGASLMLGTVLGVGLGESTVGLINPVHFQGPAVHPRERGTAINPNSQPVRGPAYGQLYGWEQGYTARAADCGDCPALAARDAYAYSDYSAEVPYFGGPREPSERIVPVRTERHGDISDKFVDAPAEDAAPVLRYAYYPVSADDGRWVEDDEDESAFQPYSE